MNQKGLGTIIIVVSISFLALVLAAGLTYLSFEGLEAGYDHINSKKNFYRAGTCLEEVLSRIRFDNSYSADAKFLEIAGASCIINTSGDVDKKNITIESQYKQYNRILEAEMTITESQLKISDYHLKQ